MNSNMNFSVNCVDFVLEPMKASKTFMISLSEGQITLWKEAIALKLYIVLHVI